MSIEKGNLVRIVSGDEFDGQIGKVVNIQIDYHRGESYRAVFVRTQYNGVVSYLEDDVSKIHAVGVK